MANINTLIPNRLQSDTLQLRSILAQHPVNTTKILQILLSYNEQGRKDLAIEFRRTSAQDLFNRIESECDHGMVPHLLKAICKNNVHQFMASELWKVYRNDNPIFNPNLDAYTDILCTVTSDDLRSIKKELKNFDSEEITTLESCIESVTSTLNTFNLFKPYYRMLLLELSKGKRSNSVNEDVVADLAKELYKAGEGKFGTDEKTFIRIFSEESYEQLRKIFDEYPNHSKHKSSIEQAIENETSGDFKAALLAVVLVTRDRMLYFVKRFHDAVTNLNEKPRFHMIWTRMIIMNLSNMNEFKQKFFDTYAKTLEQYIQESCDSTGSEGTYKTQLLTIIKQYSNDSSNDERNVTDETEETEETEAAVEPANE